MPSDYRWVAFPGNGQARADMDAYRLIASQTSGRQQGFTSNHRRRPRSLACFGGTIVYLLLSVQSAWAQRERDEDPWVCVPTEVGGWACGHESNAPEAAPLPTLSPESALSPELSPLPNPGRYTPFGQPTAGSSQPTLVEQTEIANNPPPTQSNNAGPARYTLKIASVSSVFDVARFADDYGLDDAAVRHAAVVEEGYARELVLWGEFTSPVEAQRALGQLPDVVQLIRPQIIAIASIGAPMKPLVGTDAEPTAAPKKPDDSAAATVASTPAPPKPRDSNGEPSLSTNDEEPSTLPATASQSTQIQTADNQPSRQRARRVIPLPSDVEASPPVPTSDTARSVTAEPAAHTAQDQVSRSQQAHKAGFQEVDSAWYTVQVASLKDRAATEHFVERHGLDRATLYHVQIDEGVGPRWLLLFGAYPSLRLATDAQTRLPSSLRTPWVRRVAPVQRGAAQFENR